MKEIICTVFLMILILFSCKSTQRTADLKEVATDAVAHVQRSQWHASSWDSVWRHTELFFDSCMVIFGGGAGAPITEEHVMQPHLPRQRPQSIYIYGAHLSDSRKEIAIADSTVDDCLSVVRQTSHSKVLKESRTARPSQSSLKLVLSLIFLAALLGFYLYHRKCSDD